MPSVKLTVRLVKILPFIKLTAFMFMGLSLETAALPEGWEERTNKVLDYMDENKIGWCVEAHDLAASKLMAFRDKDREFVSEGSF